MNPGMPAEALFTATPMFGNAAEPQMFQPFNINAPGPAGMALQLAMPMLMQSLMQSRGMAPSQFLPTQNYYDQLMAQQYHAAQQRAMQMASQQDQLSIQRTFNGLTRAMQGSAPTLAQQQQAAYMARTAAGALPMLSMVLGPDMVDQLVGPKGSATILAQRVHQGMQAGRDPLTGRVGGGGLAAGQVATELFQQMYGADAAPIPGLRAGAAGSLFQELAMRGMAGEQFGAIPAGDRLLRAANLSFSDAERRRIAETALRQSGKEVTAASVAGMQAQIFDGPGSTVEAIRAAGGAGALDTRLPDLQRMPGADALLSSGQAQTISQRLKGLAGVVRAMRDIFGDEGNPNAPMRQIVNGLEALTQGGLSSMNPGDLERTVRMTRNLAQQSGLGLQGMMGLTAQAGSLADQLGLDRSLAVLATQNTAAFAGAARDTMRLDMPAFGGLTAEQATLLDQQLRVQAFGSQVGNQLSASVRLQQEGLVRTGSDAALLAQAIQEGRTTFRDSAGVDRAVAMTDREWIDLMQSSGVDRGAAEAVLSDRFMNQRYARDFDTGSLARRLQRDTDVMPRVSTTMANTLTGQLRSSGVEAELARQGLTPQQISEVTASLGSRMAAKLMQADAAVVRDPKALNTYLQTELQAALSAEGAARGLDVKSLSASMGGDEALAAAVAMTGQLGNRIHHDPQLQGYRSILGLHQMHNEFTAAQQQVRMVEAGAQARMQSAYSSLGRSGPLSRLIGAIQESRPGDSFMDLALKAMGGVPRESITALEEGPFSALLSAQRLADSAERYTATSAMDEEIDRELANRRGMSLEAYREELRTDPGARAARAAAAEMLKADPAFMKRATELARVKTGGLTARGQGQMTSAALYTAGLVEGGAQAEAALQHMANQLGVEPGQLTDQFFNARMAAASPEERARLEDMQKLAAGLRSGLSLRDEAARLGYAAGEAVTAGDVRGLAKIGAKSGDQWDQKETERFLRMSRDMFAVLQASPADMEQLGAGATKRVSALQAKEQQIAELAREAGVSPAELLAGKGPADKVQQARELHSQLVAGWGDIADIKGTGLLGGAPGSKVAAMGEHEKAVAAATAAFLTDAAFLPENAGSLSEAELADSVSKAQADAAAVRLVGAMGADGAATFLSPDGSLGLQGRELSRFLHSTERTRPLLEALEAQDQLLQIAAERGVKVNGKELTAAELAKLSPKDRQAALAALKRSSPGGELGAEIDRLFELQAPLEGLGPDASLEDLQQRLGEFSGVTRGAVDAEKQTLALTGEVRVVNPEALAITGDVTPGSPEYNSMPTNMV